MQTSITELPPIELRQIKSCWERLNAIHLNDSVHFKDHYANFTFEKRMEAFASMDAKDIKLTVIKTGDTVAGYCLSTIDGGVGEVASLYIDEALREHSYGRQLVELHKEWFRSRGCRKVIVTVSHGHDSVLGFYQKLGFYERLIQLELKE
jgi:diamine N-acetyltransferase